MLALCRGPAGNPVLPLWAACREPHSPTVGVGACREPRPLFPQVRLWLAQSTRARPRGQVRGWFWRMILQTKQRQEAPRAVNRS